MIRSPSQWGRDTWDNLVLEIGNFLAAPPVATTVEHRRRIEALERALRAFKEELLDDA